MAQRIDETVEAHHDDNEQKCPGCGWRVVTTYRLSSEPRDLAVCGDCFGGWLVNELDEGSLQLVRVEDEEDEA